MFLGSKVLYAPVQEIIIFHSKCIYVCLYWHGDTVYREIFVCGNTRVLNVHVNKFCGS